MRLDQGLIIANYEKTFMKQQFDHDCVSHHTHSERRREFACHLGSSAN
jgi:hypothetical protein